MARRIADLKDRIIVCGGGDTGRGVAVELRQTRTPFVCIESDRAREPALKRLGEDVLFILGDATGPSSSKRGPTRSSPARGSGRSGWRRR